MYFIRFFWALYRRLKFICRRFGTLCSIAIYKDGTAFSEKSAYKSTDAGESSRRKHTAFRTRRNFEIKKCFNLCFILICVFHFNLCVSF
jgi:hypothetical protein